MFESACQFGEQSRLNGVITLPSESEAAESVLILVSAGFTAKSGPYRLYTELARSLADSAIATLRFDLGGIGNSSILDPAVALPLRTDKDICDAVALVCERLQPRNIIIGGLCSGAEDAFRYAERDPRITGVLLIDPHAYRTWTWRLRNVFSRRFVDRVFYKILRVLGFVSAVDRAPIAARAEGFEGDLVKYQYMKRLEATHILKELHRRKVQYHYIYTGGRFDTINHKGQFYRMFSDVAFVGLETITHLPNIEHVQIFREDRDALIDVACRWLGSTFGNRPS